MIENIRPPAETAALTEDMFSWLRPYSGPAFHCRLRG